MILFSAQREQHPPIDSHPQFHTYFPAIQPILPTHTVITVILTNNIFPYFSHSANSGCVEGPISKRVFEDWSYFDLSLCFPEAWTKIAGLKLIPYHSDSIIGTFRAPASEENICTMIKMKNHPLYPLLPITTTFIQYQHHQKTSEAPDYYFSPQKPFSLAVFASQYNHLVFDA